MMNIINPYRYVDGVIKYITLSTTSTSSTWSPFQVQNSGSTLTWDVTGGFVGSQTADDPTFNLTTNTGTANVNIYDVVGVTTLSVIDLLLVTLDVSEASNLDVLNCKGNNLTSLNVNGANSITRLECWNNSNLATLDISSNVNLTFLQTQDCNLSSIDASSNINLETFWCNGNSIITLDVTANTSLNVLHCHGNLLSSLNVTGLTSMTELTANSNESLISIIGLSSCTALETLWVHDTGFTTLDVSPFTSLTLLNCEGNSFSATVTNQILADLVANNQSNGTLHYRNNETGQGVTDRATLITRGWTITNYGS